MAIDSPSPQRVLPQRREPVDVAEWTARTAQELASLTLSTTTQASVRGTTVRLDISLDDEHPPPRPSRAVTAEKPDKAGETADPDVDVNAESKYTPKRREPLRRDSLKRREALLKGKEGSRRRQRWENGRLREP
jgi:hypothetical protein